MIPNNVKNKNDLRLYRIIIVFLYYVNLHYTREFASNSMNFPKQEKKKPTMGYTKHIASGYFSSF